jgi:hypothetical protein
MHAPSCLASGQCSPSILARRHLADTPAAVTAGRSKADPIGVQHHHSEVGCRPPQIEGSPQAGVARADNGDIRHEVPREWRMEWRLDDLIVPKRR